MPMFLYDTIVFFVFILAVSLYHHNSTIAYESLREKECQFQYVISVRIRAYQEYSLPHFGEYEKNQYDYDDVVYSIPFNRYYNEMESRYVDFGNNSLFPNYIVTGHIPPYKSGDKRLIVTGCSSNHFASVEANMVSVLNASATINMVFIDYGLTKREVTALKDIFKYLHNVHRAMNSSSFIAYRKFNFATAPTWMNINNSDEHGGYAWKIIGWMDVINEWKSFTGWIDAGSIINDGFDLEFKYVSEEGFYTPSRGAPEDYFARWTHPMMLKFLFTNHLIKHVDMKKSNAAAGHMFVDYHNETIRRRVLTPWIQCCYTMKCVLPKGSSRANHRWEQAALTSVLQNLNFTYSNNKEYHHFPYIRMENSPKSWLNDITKRFKKEINERNHIHVF